MRRVSPRVALVALVALVLGALWYLGVFASVREPRLLAQALVAQGAFGYVAFVLAYALLHPFGVPGTIFVIAAPLIWPWPIAFTLSMVGTMAASVVAFGFARFVARDWVSTRIPARLRRYDEALAHQALVTVIVLRMVLWMPQPLHWFFGVSKVRFSTHFWGSLIGYAPPLLAVSYLGSELFDSTGQLQPRAWPIMGGFLVASLIVAGLGRWYGRRASASKRVGGASEHSADSRLEH